MHENDSEREKALLAINRLYIMQVGVCIAALKELGSAELTDKNVIIRAIMRDMPDCGMGSGTPAEDCAVDLWVDRAEYVDEQSFNLYVTRAEENVLWKIEEKARKPRRLKVPQQRITVRAEAMGTAPFIPVAYLTALGGKLAAMAFPDQRSDAELSGYNDEAVMLGVLERLETILDDMTDELPDGENGAGRPVS